jgi:2-methylisocitrate lyase-like PEP mutase family enzyme
MVPRELMVAKVKEAVRARSSNEFVIIARTNAVRQTGMDDAVARGIAYREAGADMLYIAPRGPEEAREIAHNLRPYQLERLGLTNTLEYMLKNAAGSSKIKFST